jgi:hypothetical protein
MKIRIGAVVVASIFAAYGCGSSSPTSPTTPTATPPTPPDSSAATVSTQAQPAAVQVSVSVSPGTLSSDGDWCTGGLEATLTAHVVASQSEVTEGTIVWQACSGGRQGGLPKEACDGHGGARWRDQMFSTLSPTDPTPSIHGGPLPLLGWRLLYRPAPGSGLKRATSEPFNIDKTCSL